MNEGVVFAIPHRLVRLNKYTDINRANRYKGAQMKKEQTELCYYYIPKIKLDYPIEITFVWSVKNFGSDPDNISVGAKFILDAMVKRGMIKTDNLTVVKKLTHEFRRGEQEQVEGRVRRWRDA